MSMKKNTVGSISTEEMGYAHVGQSIASYHSSCMECTQTHFHMYCVIGLQVIAKLGPQYIHDLLPNMHAEQFGLTREAAELEFLKVTHISLSLHAPPLTPLTPFTCPTPHIPHPSSQEAQKLPEYGNVFYQVVKVCVSAIYV